jgi:malonyl-CoA/methylmalonyl-CoA synthetase
MGSRESSNLYAAFRQQFPADLSKTVITTAAGDHFSYRDAEEKSAQVANFLCQQGLVRGDRITVQVEKSPAMLWLYLGTLRAGMVFHPLNTAYTNDELAYFLADADPALVVGDSARRDDLSALCAGSDQRRLLTLDVDGSGSLMAGSASCSAEFVTADSQPGDLAALLYSSGTTGRPKGIMLTHANLVENACVLVDYWGFSGDDSLLHVLPVFHVHGLFVAIGCVLMSGASMRWLPRFDAAEVVPELASVTVMMGVPTYYTRLLSQEEFDAASCSKVRLFVSGSAPLLPETFAEFEQRTGKAILERYGMTETGMNASNPLVGERRAGTVGLPLPGVSLRVVDANGQVLGPGEVGDLQVKGPNVFAGYWNMPEKTAEDFTDDGYFVTGDKGCFDDDGYLAIVGRAKDMVISGGLNVYPREIELLIDELPQVLESAVIGVPHPDFGEAVTAVVVLRPGAELPAAAVIEHVKTHAANFKVPKKVFFSASLPRNTMGKVQKNVLRERYE